MRLSFTLAAILPLSGVLAGHIAPFARRSHAAHNLQKRDSRATFYEVGLGACGGTNSDSEFVVAMNVDGFNGGSACYKMITVTYNGKSTQAQVVDECPTCPGDAIDMSPSLFSFFAPQSEGQIFVQWSFGGAPQSSSSSSSTWSAPTSTSSSTTSSSSSSSTSTSSVPSSSSSSSSSVSITANSTSSAVQATPTPSIPAGNVADLADLLVALGQVVLHSASKQ